jgi:hypothetical protein
LISLHVVPLPRDVPMPAQVCSNVRASYPVFSGACAFRNPT